MGNDGVQLEEHSCVHFPQELMEKLRAWAAERHLGDHLPGLILLVAHLGEAGLVVADCFYRAGEVQGYEESTRAWESALGELQRTDEEGQ